MSFEHQHPNREVNRNLARARDLRSAYLFACAWTIGGFIARVWRVPRRSRVPDLQMPAGR